MRKSNPKPTPKVYGTNFTKLEYRIVKAAIVAVMKDLCQRRMEVNVADVWSWLTGFDTYIYGAGFDILGVNGPFTVKLKDKITELDVQIILDDLVKDALLTVYKSYRI